jgi:hypothetical protein
VGSRTASGKYGARHYTLAEDFGFDLESSAIGFSLGSDRRRGDLARNASVDGPPDMQKSQQKFDFVVNSSRAVAEIERPAEWSTH